MANVWGALLLSSVDLSTCHGLGIQPLPSELTNQLLRGCSQCWEVGGRAGRSELGHRGGFLEEPQRLSQHRGYLFRQPPPRLLYPRDRGLWPGRYWSPGLLCTN